MRTRLLITITGACILLRLIFAAGAQTQGFGPELCLAIQEEVKVAVNLGLITSYEAMTIVDRCFYGAETNE